MVGAGRIELPTPAMSTQCSPTELRARRGGLRVAGVYHRRPLASSVIADAGSMSGAGYLGLGIWGRGSGAGDPTGAECPRDTIYLDDFLE